MKCFIANHCNISKGWHFRFSVPLYPFAAAALSRWRNHIGLARYLTDDDADTSVFCRAVRVLVRALIFTELVFPQP